MVCQGMALFSEGVYHHIGRSSLLLSSALVYMPMFLAKIANHMDPDQTAPKGAV